MKWVRGERQEVRSESISKEVGCVDFFIGQWFSFYLNEIGTHQKVLNTGESALLYFLEGSIL